MIFCGLINKKGVKCLNNRKDSLEIDSMEIKGKGERCKLKMQFSSEENCEEVLTKITSIVE